MRRFNYNLPESNLCWGLLSPIDEYTCVFNAREYNIEGYLTPSNYSAVPGSNSLVDEEAVQLLPQSHSYCIRSSIQPELSCHFLPGRAEDV